MAEATGEDIATRRARQKRESKRSSSF